MNRIDVASTRREQLVDITSRIRQEVRRAGIGEGVCVVYCPHTTAGLTINEHADPAVAGDLIAALRRAVPDDAAWSHREGNAAAHVKAALVGASACVPVVDGDLALGTWQGVFLCEFDGPRTRSVWLRFVA